ncbi:MAG TPA: citrate synthase [Planctomycetota bacterium]|jgi:citrate synthase|nr:citrate synthase [Planctomycetota bacterium]
MAETARLEIAGKTVDLPIMVGSEGEVAVDIRNLRQETGAITYDPGYGNTGSCTSDITFINGEEGILRYGGYPIEQLAEKSTFLEVCLLLLNGELPTRKNLDDFTHEVTQHTMLHEDLGRFYRALPKDAHPMAVCSTVVAALSTFYPHLHLLSDPAVTRAAIVRLIAKLPTIAAFTYKHSKGQPFIYPENSLDYCSNFLRMMFATPCEPYEPNPIVAKALDLLLILHADHEQNCSTSTVRLVGSSKPHLFACISAGIGALWGPLHGGANQQVIEMLERIAAEEGSAEKFIQRAKDRNDTARLMGFGHRVYKNYDPRAKILRKMAIKVLESLKVQSPLLDIAMKLEAAAMSDPYFVERRLYPNVDFYSGIIYKAIGIPVPMFTVLFAMGRLPGWIAQWQEMHSQPDFRIGRPRQIYTGPTARDYVAIDKR